MNQAHVLSQDSITLRPIELSDTDYIVKWRNSDFVKQRMINKELSKEMHVNWFRTKVMTGDVVQFIIEFDNNPVGTVFLKDIDRNNQNAEFGIFIGEKTATNKGIGAVAAKRIISLGFSELKLHKIFLRVLADNQAAIKCYEKAGFSYEGTAKEMVYLDGSYVDVVFMSIICGQSA